MNKVEAAVKIAFRLYGTPYIYGGKSITSGLDCSGFVQTVFHEIGLMPHPMRHALNTDAMWAEYRRYQLGPNTAKISGMILFYGKPDDVNHVMVAIGPDLCIGAAGGDSDCTNLDIARRRDARVKVMPINYRPDLVGAIDLIREV